MREDTSFKGFDLSCPFIYFPFYDTSTLIPAVTKSIMITVLYIRCNKPDIMTCDHKNETQELPNQPLREYPVHHFCK